jgi:hypothetical protein
METMSRGKIMADEELRYPHWQGPYLAAISESNSSELLKKIQAAEFAIYERCQILAPGSDHLAEREAIADALAELRRLQRDKLSFPDFTER